MAEAILASIMAKKMTTQLLCQEHRNHWLMAPSKYSVHRRGGGQRSALLFVVAAKSAGARPRRKPMLIALGFGGICSSGLSRVIVFAAIRCPDEGGHRKQHHTDRREQVVHFLAAEGRQMRVPMHDDEPDCQDVDRGPMRKTIPMTRTINPVAGCPPR